MAGISNGWSGGLGVEEEGKLSGLGTTIWFFRGMGGGQGVEAGFFHLWGRGGDVLLDGVEDEQYRKSDSRKGAKTQRRMGTMVDTDVLEQCLGSFKITI